MTAPERRADPGRVLVAIPALDGESE